MQQLGKFDWGLLSEVGSFANLWVEGKNAQKFGEQQERIIRNQNTQKKHKIDALADYQIRINNLADGNPRKKSKNFLSRHGMWLGIGFGSLSLIMIAFYADKKLNKKPQ